MKNATIRWALVGLGQQAERMAHAMKDAGHNLVAAVGEGSHVQPFIERHGGNKYQSLKQLLTVDKKEDLIDAICITSENALHAQEAIMALRAGKDVLCEKPLALRLSDAKKIARCAQKSGARCFVDFQYRLHPAIQEARTIIARKELGELLYVDMHWSIGNFGETRLPPLPPHMRWRESPRESGGGALVARGVHLFDLLRFLTNRDVTDVSARSDSTSHSVDRTMVGLFALNGNVPATLVSSKRMPASENIITIYGSEGRIKIDAFSSGESSLELVTQKKRARKTYKPQKLFAAVMVAFAAARRGNNTDLASVEDGVRSVAVTEAFTRSARSGKRIKVSA